VERELTLAEPSSPDAIEPRPQVILNEVKDLARSFARQSQIL